jgi:hypothetical protein
MPKLAHVKGKEQGTCAHLIHERIHVRLRREVEQVNLLHAPGLVPERGPPQRKRY